MATMTSFRDLEVWQRSMDLVEASYHLTASLPPEERFGLSVQMRRAAVSISANIAEGHRRPRRAYLNHLSIALGSHAEFETYVDLNRRLRLANDRCIADVDALTRSVGQLLHALVRSLERS
jgi:four helix bundle protein